MENTLFIVDAYGFIFRAYHIQPELRNEDGVATGALFGFTNMMFKLLNDFRPPFITLVFDGGSRGFRQELYPPYKTHRPATPEDLKQQFPLIWQAAEALNISAISDSDHEADDLIASIAVQYAKTHQVVIVSSDKDLMQLITPNVCLYDPTKNCYIQAPEVQAKFGVLPTQLQDWLAIVGDRADNIPGIAGIGPKTATELINKYSNLEGILANLHHISQKKIRENLEKYTNEALIFKQIVGLRSDLSFDLDLEQLRWQAPHRSMLYEFLRKYNFGSLLSKAERLFNSAPARSTGISLQPLPQNDSSPLAQVEYLTIEMPTIFTLAMARTQEKGIFAFLLKPEQLFISFETNKGICVITTPATQDFLAILLTYLQNLSICKVTYNIKAVMKQLANHGFSMEDIIATNDLMLMHYAVNTGKPQPKLEMMLAGIAHDSSEITMVQAMLSHYPSLLKQLQQAKALVLYYELDLPIAQVLFTMEQHGIAIDGNLLETLSEELEQQISNLTKNIFLISGKEFNIGSPKQLGEVLFGKLGLPYAKLSKNKNYTTNSEVLERLKETGSGIAEDLLEWRQLTKLKNTYVDTLPKQVNPLTGRIHTTLLQTSTNTARLSSVNPNLQNIPIRSQEGNKIRAAFIPAPGHALISADYSQIELRLLSSIANIPALKEAFIKELDIHAQTASQVFGIDLAHLDHEHRRKAKAINFGIIYGISPFGLAKQLGISTYEAKNYIDRYFAEYPEIEEYMQQTKEFVRRNHFVLNLLGRKCFIPDIQSNNSIIRGFAERAAINAPIQSTAADIVKMAMLAVSKALKPYKTRLLLQVHDELLFEVPVSEVEEVMQIIKQQLEGVIKLEVPLTVVIKAGKNWAEIH